MLKRLIQRATANRRYFHNLTATFCSQAVTAISVFLLTPHLLDKLGEASFNQYGVVLNLIIVAAVADLGQSVGLSHRLIQRKRNYSLLITTVLGAQVLVFLLALPVLYLVYTMRWVQVTGHPVLLSLLTASIMLQNIMALLFDGVLQSFNKIYISKWLRVGRTLVETTLIWLLLSRGSLLALLGASLVVNLLFVGALYHFSRRQCSFDLGARYFNLRVLRSHLCYSVPYMMTILAGLIAFNVQLLLLQSLLLPFYMALFLLLFRFFELIRTGLTNFTLVLFPSISGLQATGSWMQIEQLFFTVIKRVGLLTLLVSVVLLLAGHPLFVWWSGYAKGDIGPLFYLFTVYSLLLVIDNVSVVFQYSLNIQRVPALVSIGQSLVSLLLTWWLVPSMGIVGAVVASLLSAACITFIFNPLYLLKTLRRQQMPVAA